MSSQNHLADLTPINILYKTTVDCLWPTPATPSDSLSPAEEALITLVASLTVAQVIAEMKHL